LGAAHEIAQGLSGKAADALGLTIPSKLLFTADEVIEWDSNLLRCKSPEMTDSVEKGRK
jgi:hypothetical protein